MEVSSAISREISLLALCGQAFWPHFANLQSLTALCGQMKKSIHSDEYSIVLKKLIQMREEAGLTQRDLVS
jgi:hypothetical protein